MANLGSGDPAEVAKEVWQADEIETKTELTAIQVQTMNMATTLANVTNSGFLKEHINQFMKLQKSLERKSMKEFIEGLRSSKDRAMEKAKSINLWG